MSCAFCRKQVEKDGRYTYTSGRAKIDNYKISDDVEICLPCATKEITRLKVEKIYKPALDSFSSIVNDTLFDADTTTVDAILQAFLNQHRTLQSNMFNVMATVIKKIADLDEDMFDVRNSWIQDWAKKAKKAWEQ